MDDKQKSFLDILTSPLTGDYRKKKPVSVKAADVAVGMTPVGSAVDIGEELGKEDPSYAKIGVIAAGDVLGAAIPAVGPVAKSLIKEGVQKLDEVKDLTKNAETNALASQSSINKFGYDVFNQGMGARDLLGPGFRALTLGGVSGTDIPLKYASEGEYFLPFMEYEGPDKENLERLTFMTEVGAGVPALVRGLGKRFLRNRDAVSPDLDEAIKEYMRD